MASSQKPSDFVYIAIVRDPSESDTDLPSRMVEACDDIAKGEFKIVGIFDDPKESFKALMRELKRSEGFDIAVLEIIKAEKNKKLSIGEWHDNDYSDETAPETEVVFEIAIFDSKLLKYSDWKKVPEGIIECDGKKKRTSDTNGGPQKKKVNVIEDSSEEN
jgi:hypothetical protein